MQSLDVLVVVALASSRQHGIVCVDFCFASISVGDFIIRLMSTCHHCKLLSFNLARTGNPSIVERPHVEARRKAGLATEHVGVLVEVLSVSVQFLTHSLLPGHVVTLITHIYID